MRVMIFLTATVLAGCATQPGSPHPDTGAPPPTAGVAASDISATDAAERRLALAKKLHLKLVNQDGEEVFCKSTMVTASHIRTDVKCYTAQELDRLQEQTDRDVDSLYKPIPNAPGKAFP